MAGTRVSHILLSLMAVLHIILAQTGEDFKLLHEELFHTRSYQKVIIPRVTLRKAMFISLGFNLRGIICLDELEERLSTMAYLTLQWNDTFLEWNKRQFSNISYTYMPQNEVWKPDISLHNGFTKLKELGDDVILVKIHSSGRMVWKPFEVFETYCDMDVTKFPFDQQTCQLIFKMWASEPEDLKFALKVSALNTELYEPNGVWELRSSKIELISGHVIVSLTLDRRPQYFLLTLICPIILLSFLSIFTFVIPVDSGEKMGYSMTVYLAFAVFLTIVSSSLPANSRTISYMAVYLVSLLVKGTTIVIVTAVQVRLHHRQSSVDLPPSLRRVVSINKRMFMCSRRRVNPNEIDVTKKEASKIENSKSNESASFSHVFMVKECSDASFSSDIASSENEDSADERFTWADVSSALDRFFFCFFFTVAVVLTNVFFTLAL